SGEGRVFRQVREFGRQCVLQTGGFPERRLSFRGTTSITQERAAHAVGESQVVAVVARAGFGDQLLLKVDRLSKGGIAVGEIPKSVIRLTESIVKFAQ